MSAPSASVVEPTTSAKRTDTRRRSRAAASDPDRSLPGVAAGVAGPVAGGAPGPIVAPHSPQKRSPASAAAPQTGHVGASATPHDRQNRPSARLSAPQLEQEMRSVATFPTAYRLRGPAERG